MLMNGRARATLARFQSIKGELAWIVTGQAVGAVGGLVSVRLLTSLISPLVYGEIALGLTVAGLVSQSLFGPLSNGITRFYAPADEYGDVARYLRAGKTLVIFATLTVVAATVPAVAGLAIAGKSRWIGLIVATLGFAVLTGYNGILSSVQNAARQRSIVALHQGIESWTRFLVAASFVLLFGATSSVAMWGYTFGIVLVLASQYVFFKRIKRTVNTSLPQMDWKHEIVKYSWPFCTWSLFTWTQLSSDRWALGLFAGAREVGLYAVLFQLGNYPISMATTMAIQLLAPIFFQRAGDGRDGERNEKVSKMSWRLTVFILSITVLAFGVGLWLHATIFHILVAPKFVVVSHLFPWVLLASGIYAASQTIEISLMSQMKTRSLIVAKITTAVFGVALNFAGAYKYGITGVVLAGVAFSSFYFIWMIFLAKSRREAVSA